MDKQEALNITLLDLKTYGFTESLIQKQKLNFASYPFSDVKELLVFFLQTELSIFSSKLEDITASEESISKKILAALDYKIENSDIQRVKSLQTYFLTKAEFLLLHKHLFKLSDIIWISCADKSLDLNYYSKRIILMHIILLSFLHLSRYEDKERSKKFAGYLVDKSKNFGKLKKLMKGLF